MRYVAATPTMPAMAAESAAAAEPPLADSYLELLRRGGDGGIIAPPTEGCVQERELPLIDLSCLMASGRGRGGSARAACADAMARAASEWGFFQVTGHGVSRALLERLRAEQARLFRLPFETKAKAGLLNGSYRWGAPTATSLRHLSWSEAFHVPLASISSGGACDFGDLTSLRYLAFFALFLFAWPALWSSTPHGPTPQLVTVAFVVYGYGVAATTTYYIWGHPYYY